MHTNTLKPYNHVFYIKCNVKYLTVTFIVYFKSLSCVIIIFYSNSNYVI